MVLVGGRYVPASSVRIGDQIESANGDLISIEAIKKVTKKGVYAPFTTSGTIVVSDIKASSFIAFQDSDRLIVGGWKTPLTFQWIAYMSQSPHRLASRLGLCGAEEYTPEGLSTWITWSYELWVWFLEQNCVIMTLLLIPAIGVGLMSLAMENVVSWLF